MTNDEFKSNRVRPIFRILAAIFAVVFLLTVAFDLTSLGFADYKFQIPGTFWAVVFLFVAITGRGPKWLR
jgi:hypothetical protein